MNDPGRCYNISEQQKKREAQGTLSPRLFLFKLIEVNTCHTWEAVKRYICLKAKEYGCKIIYFIIDKENSLKDELEGQEKDSSSLLKFSYIYGLNDIIQ